MSPTTIQRRLVAVEEHFATDEYHEQLETQAVPAEEEPERAFMLGFPHVPKTRTRFTAPRAIVDSMDAAGIDRSVVSRQPSGVQIFTDAVRASALAGQMNDTLAERVRLRRVLDDESSHPSSR